MMGSADGSLDELRARRRALIDEMGAVHTGTSASDGRCIALMKELRTLDARIACVTSPGWRGWDRGYRLVLVPDSFRGG